MGRMINPYDAPLSRDEYEYLRVRCETFKIQENERMFGPLGKVEGYEWPEVEEEAAPEVEEAKEETPATEYDADDVLFVDSIGYGEHQQLLKEMGRKADGSKSVVRQRLLDAIKEEGGIREVVEFDDPDGDGLELEADGDEEENDGKTEE